MFGRTTRLAIDAVLVILGQRVGGASPSGYMRQLELHLADAFKRKTAMWALKPSTAIICCRVPSYRYRKCSVFRRLRFPTSPPRT
ncbi:hypothetical protein DPMN_135350 [Dreissena polymorpha]|uniref:Uncharacterized protein n=1 Tax=Dreissena polymorpha TaxID=45954 RepID=A0A9D4JFQ1_DREPO|nr:hypothetical protein DPMN_135350 [Dreissena polymorpha]